MNGFGYKSSIVQWANRKQVVHGHWSWHIAADRYSLGLVWVFRRVSCSHIALIFSVLSFWWVSYILVSKYVCKHDSLYVYTCSCKHMWKPEGDGMIPFLLNFHIILWDKVSYSGRSWTVPLELMSNNPRICWFLLSDVGIMGIYWTWVTGVYWNTCLLYDCWESELRTQCLPNKCFAQRAISLLQCTNILIWKWD